jgi:hypothetical protein
MKKVIKGEYIIYILLYFSKKLDKKLKVFQMKVEEAKNERMEKFCSKLLGC